MPKQRHEKIWGFTETSRKAHLTQIEVRLLKRGWTLKNFSDKGFLNSNASFERTRLATTFEKCVDTIDPFRHYLVGLLIFSVLAIFIPFFRLLLLIPVFLSFIKVGRAWESLSVSGKILGFICAVIVTTVGVSWLNKVTEERKAEEARQRAVREAEHEAQRGKELQFSSKVAGALLTSLRSNGVSEALITDVKVHKESGVLFIFVTNTWLEQPEYSQKQMKKTLELLLKKIAPPQGHSFQLVDYMGNEI